LPADQRKHPAGDEDYLPPTSAFPAPETASLAAGGRNRGSPTVFDGSVIGRDRQRHRHQSSPAKARFGSADFARLGKGGVGFDGPWGASVASNITASPMKASAPGAMRRIKRAITEGKSRDGRPLKPMNYRRYRRISGPDLDALVAWLRTVPPQE
jgi:hypothetical protein